MERVTKEKILMFLKEQKPYLYNTFHLTKIGLFGSFANESATSNSDIDLIVEFEEGTSDIFGKKESLRNLLFNEFHCSVDVANEKYLKPYYRQQIIMETIYV